MQKFVYNNSLLNTSAPVQYYWDANGNSSGIGGTGTLNNQSLVVRKSSSTGPLTIYPNDQIKNNTMIFDGVGGTVTFPTFSFSPLKVMNFNKIIVKTNNYIFSQYAIEFVKNNPEIYIESGVVCRSNRYLKSSTTLTKSGLGTLVLRDSFFLMNSLYIKEGAINYQASDNYATHYMPPININTNSSLIIAISTVTNSIFAFPNNFSGNGIIQRDPNSPTVYPPTNNSTMAITGNNINFTGEWRFNAGYGYVLFSNDNAVGAPNVGIRCSGASAGFYFNTSGNTLASTRTITLVGGCNFLWNGTAGRTNTIASLITGNGSLTKQSSETHILTNENNNYNGGTTVLDTGRLIVTKTGCLGSGPLNLQSSRTDATTTFMMNGSQTINNTININTANGRNNLESINGNVTITGNIVVTGASTNAVVYLSNTNGNNLTISGNISGTTTGTQSFRGAIGSTGTISGIINTPNSILNVDNNGTWTINSSGNSYQSTNFANNGKFILGTNNALCTTGRLVWGGTSATNFGICDLNGYDQTVAGLESTLTVNGNITNNSASSNSVLTLSGLTTNYTYNSNITDGPSRNIALIMNSAGRTQNLGGNNTYSAGTTINGGTIRITNTNALGTGTVTVNSGGTLNLNGLTISNTIINNGGTVIP